MEKYKELIRDKWQLLKDKGIFITQFGITENATIKINLLNMNYAIITNMLSELNNIPTQLLVIRKGVIATLYSAADYNRPLVSGLKTTARDSADFNHLPATMGFVGYDEYARSGFLACAHQISVADSGGWVYQPDYGGTSSSPYYNNRVGSDNYGITFGTGDKADVAWVQIWKSDITFTERVYSSGYPIEVRGHAFR